MEAPSAFSSSKRRLDDGGKYVWLAVVDERDTTHQGLVEDLVRQVRVVGSLSAGRRTRTCSLTGPMRASCSAS